MLLNSQKTHMTLHAYARMKATGAETLFPLQHLLRSFGGDVIWATKTGYESVFAASERTLQEKPSENLWPEPL